MNWQPIETAPKDGTRVLLFDGACCVVAAWLDNRTSRRGRRLMDWCIPESWQDEQGGYWTVIPTHWQPLPEPPQ